MFPTLLIQLTYLLCVPLNDATFDGIMPIANSFGTSLQANLVQGIKSELLTKEEDMQLRGLVYNHRLMIVTSRKTANRHLYVPQLIIDLHNKKRLATVKRLLDIVRGGNPEDALRAAGLAIALEENPFVALPCYYASRETFDQTNGPDKETRRDFLIGRVENMLKAR